LITIFPEEKIMKVVKLFFLFIILTVPVFYNSNASAQTVLRTVNHKFQECNNWCWAAVSQAVCEYYCRYAQQTAIVEWAKGATLPCVTNTMSGMDNRSIQHILNVFGGISSESVNYAMPMKSEYNWLGIKTKQGLTPVIGDGKPIIAHVPNHFVVIHGFDWATNSLFISDPAHGKNIFTYDDFKNVEGWDASLYCQTGPPSKATHSATGDAKSDLLLIDYLAHHVRASSGSGFNSQLFWGLHGGSLLNNFFPGDVNRDGRTDMVYLGSDWAWYVRLTNSSGNGYSAPYPPVAWIPAYGFGHSNGMHYSGDFNGDGRMDLLFFETGTNGIYVTISTGSGFGGSGSGMWTNAFGYLKDNYLTGDFNGDGRTDLAFISPSYEIHVRLSTGSGFAMGGARSITAPLSQWSDAGQFGHANGRYLVGDFDGDNNDDLLFFNASANEHRVRLSNGSSRFEVRPGMSEIWIGSNGFGWNKDNFYTADFNGDELMDLGYYESSNDSYHVRLSNGSTFYLSGSSDWIDPGQFGVDHDAMYIMKSGWRRR
jgi:hypothetical protein